MIVGAPDAHVDPIEEVVGAIDVQPFVQVLQVGVNHDLIRIGNVFLDCSELVVGSNLGLGVHPGYLVTKVT